MSTTVDPGGRTPVTIAVRDGMVDLSVAGPLDHICGALAARLGTVFPREKFGFQLLSGPVTHDAMTRLTQRLPALALAWTGVKPDGDQGRVFMGASQWTLLLLTQNAAGDAQRLLGDALAPGLFAMVQAATVALEGFTLAQEASTVAVGATPWVAEGSVRVTNVTLVTAEGFEARGFACAQLAIEVRYAATYAPGSGWAAPDFLSMGLSWGFPGTFPADPPFSGDPAIDGANPGVTGPGDGWTAPGAAPTDGGYS